MTFVSCVMCPLHMTFTSSNCDLFVISTYLTLKFLLVVHLYADTRKHTPLLVNFPELLTLYGVLGR